MLYSDCGSERHVRRALTLLEMMVSLGILAVLSTMAVRALDPIADQSRYEATQRLLLDLREATVGDRRAKGINGEPIVRGFVSDVGRLPTSLSDFTTLPAGVIAFSSQSFDSDRDTVDDVTLSSGWKGPYLQLGIGQDSIVDGWNRAPLIDPDAGTFDIRSLGADGDSIAPEDGYLADVITEIPTTEFLSETIVFRLFAIDGTTGARIDPAPTGLEQLAVLVYSVNGNGGTTGAIEESTLIIAPSGTFEAAKTNMIHGPIAARGFLWTDTDSDDQLDAGETVVASSYVHYFIGIGGIDRRIEMELR